MLGVGRLVKSEPNSRGEHLGSAFVVSHDLALTAFHCIGDRDANRIDHPDPSIRLQDGSEVPTRVLSADPLIDYALLRFNAPIDGSVTPIPLVVQGFNHMKFRCPGFPESIEGPDWLAIGGEIQDMEGQVLGQPAIQLYGVQSGAGMPLAGISGAPVLVGNPEGAIGIARWNQPRQTDPGVALGGTFFACPIASVVQREERLKTLIHKLSDTQLIDEGKSAFDTAVDDAVKNQLKHTLDQLNRHKVFHEGAVPRGREWTQLPSFGIRFPMDLRDSEVTRSTLNLFTSMIGLALLEVTPRHETEVQFASLVYIHGGDGYVQFSFKCPFMTIISFMRDHSPPRMKMAELMPKLESTVLDIRRKFRIWPDCWLPLVFAFKPPLRELLVINENHFLNPNQFLNPHLCKTTSGFLNFYGTVSASLSASPRQVFLFENFEGAMNAGLDEWFRWLYEVLDTGHSDPERIYVKTSDPETYSYDYTAQRQI